MKRILVFVSIFFICCIQLYGQDTFCGSVLDIEDIKNNKSLYQEFLLAENQIINFRSRRSTLQSEEEKIIIIPVVIHVLHHGEATGSGFNISEAQINSQINVLNADFRRLNEDRVHTPTFFQSVAADLKIEFRLARIDPNGNPTNGIQRRQTGTILNSNDDLNTLDQLTKFTVNGGLDAWDPSRYLNIWVRNINPVDGGQLLGYAQFPFEFHNSPNTDGVVVLTSAFGKGNYILREDNNLGRTTTHEVGHWLNLFHIWGDRRGCDNGNDFCNDTPDQFFSNQECAQIHPFCSSTGDMWMNYMDYTHDQCKNIFTEDQKTRVRSLFENGGIRESLKVSGQLFFAEISGPSTICDQATYTIDNLPAGATVQWSAGNNNLTLVSQQGNTAVFRKNGNGLSSVRVTINNSVTKSVQDIVVGVPDPIKMAIIKSGNEGKLCINMPNEFSVTYDGDYKFLNEEILEYEWQISDGWIIEEHPSASFGDVHPRMFAILIRAQSPSTYGYVNVSVRARNACGWSAWTSSISYTKETCGGYFLSIYPNPATDQVTLSLPVESSSHTSVSSTTAVKNTASSGVTQIQLWSGAALLKSYQTTEPTYQLSVEDLPQGIYFVVVIKDGKRYSQKLIKK